jgi:hypothetical protein
VKAPSNTPPSNNPRDLAKHFSDTYFSLRLGLAVLAFALPFVLYLYGKFRHGLDLQPSMSAYFWAATAEHCATFPMRTIFVGFLFAVAISLYLYKGLTTLENYLLNAAAICAGLVAVYPERLTPAEALTDPRIRALYENCSAVRSWSEQPSLPIHHTAAITLFALLAIVAWKCAHKSLDFLPADADRKTYERRYKRIALAMILFPLPGLAVAFVFGQMTHWIFFVEAAGVITFGTYWAVKSRELALSGLEKDPVEAVGHAARRKGTTPKS